MGIHGRLHHPQSVLGVVSEGALILAAVHPGELCLCKQEVAQCACDHAPPPQWVGGVLPSGNSANVPI